MLRRVLVLVASILLVIPLVATQVDAAARVEEAFHGAFAEGAWRSSSTSFGWTLVSREQDGTTHLFVHQFIDATVNGGGDVITGTEIRGETTSNVSFAIDTIHYTGASVSGAVPVSRCTILNGSETNCSDAGTMSLSATWVGVGPIPHFPDTELSWDGCLQVDRNSSVEREAIFTVSLSLNGQPMPASQDGFAGFGRGISRLIFACPPDEH
jgi:hypothetical protein